MMITHNEPLATRNTFRVGGAASYFLRVASIDDLREGVRSGKANGLAVFVLGEGSNMLFSDKGFDGLVLQIATKGIAVEEGVDSALFVAAAGEHWDGFVAQAIEKGYAGVENLSGIPGTVGATPIQNVGAYGADVSDVIEWVEVFDTESGTLEQLSYAECKFSYRDSLFKTPAGKRFIVTRVAYRLRKNATPRLEYKDIALYFKDKKPPTLAEIREAVLTIRGRKFPDLAIYGCAGSFFKNTILTASEFETLKGKFNDIPSYPMQDGRVKIPVAWLIERFGWKGKREGNVGSYANHSLVLVNYGGATAMEVKNFAQKIIDDVFQKSGVHIEPEVQLI